MKTLRILSAACVLLAASGIAGPVAAQAPETDLSRQQEAIQALSFMFGRWEGEASTHRGPEAEVSRMLEKITPRLDGTLLLIEGHGTRAGADDEDTTHEAVAVIWFDESEDRYRMKTFIPGRTADADVERTDNGLVWGFATPGGGRVRYTATFTEDTWTERGEFSRDGEAWLPFLDMSLERVESGG